MIKPSISWASPAKIVYGISLYSNAQIINCADHFIPGQMQTHDRINMCLFFGAILSHVATYLLVHHWSIFKRGIVTPLLHRVYIELAQQSV